MKFGPIIIVVAATLGGAALGLLSSRPSMQPMDNSSRPSDAPSLGSPISDVGEDASESAFLPPDFPTQAAPALGTDLWPDAKGWMAPLTRLTDGQLVFIAENQIGKLAPPAIDGSIVEITAAQSDQRKAVKVVHEELKRRGFHKEASELFAKCKQDTRESDEIVNRQIRDALKIMEKFAEAAVEAAVEEEENAAREIAEIKASHAELLSKVEVERWMMTQKHGESGRQHWSPNASADDIRHFKERPESWTITDDYASAGSDVALVTVTIHWRGGKSSEWSITLDGCIDSLDSGRPKILRVEPL